MKFSPPQHHSLSLSLPCTSIVGASIFDESCIIGKCILVGGFGFFHFDGKRWNKSQAAAEQPLHISQHPVKTIVQERRSWRRVIRLSTYHPSQSTRRPRRRCPNILLKLRLHHQIHILQLPPNRPFRTIQPSRQFLLSGGRRFNLHRLRPL